MAEYIFKNDHHRIIPFLIASHVLFFISCREATTIKTSIIDTSPTDSIPNDSIKQPINYVSGMGNRSENFINVNPRLLPANTIIPFTGKIRKSDFPKYGFILDTLSYDRDSGTIFLNSIYGITQTNFFIYNYIVPEKEEEVLKEYSFWGDTIIIPFRYDTDNEGTILTRWVESGSDSLEYVDYFKTPFGTKYARLKILDVEKYKDKRIIIGKTRYAEEGEYGEQFWLAEILSDKRLDKHDLTSSDGHYNTDSMVHLQFEKIKDGLKIYKALYHHDLEKGITAKHPTYKKPLGMFRFDDYFN